MNCEFDLTRTPERDFTDDLRYMSRIDDRFHSRLQTLAVNPNLCPWKALLFHFPSPSIDYASMRAT
jgi:hypothetical protein